MGKTWKIFQKEKYNWSKDTNLARWEQLVQHGDSNCALHAGKELRSGFQAFPEQEAENRIKHAYFNILLYSNKYM